MEVDLREDEFIPRPYQTEILEIATKENTIIYLPTGTGKTFIAIMLINRLSHNIIKPNDQKSVFLVNTIPLVEQHSTTLKRLTDFEVGQFSSEQNVDFWSEDQWLTQLAKFNIIVLTAQIFLDILRHGYFSMEKVNLLIFDECHQAVNDQPMRQIMQLFQTVDEAKRPRVLGLTATLLNGNCPPCKVMMEVRSLEKTFHGTVATVKSLSHVAGFSTNPRERLIQFDSSTNCEIISRVIEMIQNLMIFIRDVNCTTMKKASPKKLLNNENKFKPFIKILNSLILHIQMFGIYGGKKATLSCIIQFEREKRHAEESFIYKFLNVITTVLSMVEKLLEDVLEGFNRVEQIYMFSSPQVLALIEILQKYKSNPESLCAIIFVQQRFTAKIVYYVLKDLSECDPDFHFIKTEFMVGFNAGSAIRDTREAYYCAKINKKIVSSFQNNEINVLVASNVVEEGIDIPKCTLVVKFDRPMDYRSYIQSKGRARHGNSDYLILVPSVEYPKYILSYQTFNEIENLLQKFLVGKTSEREAPTQFEIQKELYEDHDVPPYFVNGPDSPHIAAVSAISLLNRYCQSLHRDKYAPLAPECYIENHGSEYVVVIEMPILCPIRTEIKGPVMATKTAAKRAAAMEACIKLHQIGELTDHLLPRTDTEDEADFDYLFQNHWLNEAGNDTGSPKPGTNKFIRHYKTVVPKYLIGPKTNTYFLHPIVMITDWDTKQPQIPFTNLDYALLTKKPLPCLCAPIVFTSSGEIEICIMYNYKTITLSDSDINDLRKFNYFLFFDIFSIHKHFLMYDNEDDSIFLMVVPVDNILYEIEMDIVRENTAIVPVDEPSIQDKIDLTVSKESHYGQVVSPWYKNSEPYIVLEVCDSLNALSPFPNEKCDTFQDYYRENYGKLVHNPLHPLLMVKGISKRLNCILPRSVTIHGAASKRKSERFQEYLIPEMCVLQKYPGTLWYKGSVIPTVLYRITCLLRTEELRVQIDSETGDGEIKLPQTGVWKPLNQDPRVLKSEEKKIQTVQQRNVSEADVSAILPSQNSTHPKPLTNKDYAMKMLEKQYMWKDEEEPVDIDRNIDDLTLLQIQYYEHFVFEKYTFDNVDKAMSSPKTSKYRALTFDQEYQLKEIKMLSRENNHRGPEQCVIFQCLTSQSAHDIVNLERLETLGDSFLKLTTTLFLFLKYPQSNEGRLTHIKGKIIGNRNLTYCGIKKSLGGYMNVSDFDPRTDWTPPGFCIPEMIINGIKNNDISVNNLFEFDIPAEEQISGELSEETKTNFNKIISKIENHESEQICSSMYRYLGQQDVPDKTIADCVEALIGAYLESNGLTGGLGIIGWFDILPKHLNPENLFKEDPPSPLLHPFIDPNDIDFHIPNYQKLEQNLGYQFKNRAYLLQALTHASYSINRCTNCYQRLEFLGDAVLDFLITSHIFEISDNLTPGQLTDLRSALVNNVTFAVLVARNGFHKYLKFMNTKLMDVLDVFVKFQEERDFNITEETLILVEEHQLYIAENVHVPKVMGDLFESLAGAVFLDSGMDLQVTWKVFHRLMSCEIETFRLNVPKNPVRMLFEHVNAVPHFQPAHVIDNNVTAVGCSVMINGKKHDVHGFGENKTQAKRAAAKLALRLLSPV